MKGGQIMLSLLSFALSEVEAAACSPPPALDIYFGGGSSELNADTLSSMDPALAELRLHGPKCTSFVINAFSYDDFGGDRSRYSIELTKARAENVKEALIKFGAKPETIRIFTAARVRSEGIALSFYGAGRLHCDPSSRNPKYVDGANCEPQYTRCYQQLEDGTVCNYSNVPDPNRTRYSVTP